MSSPFHTSNPKVMIVDDNAMFRALIKEYLKPWTSAFIECSSGSEAVALFEHVQPDWVTMDIEMEGLDGLAASRQIKSKYPEAAILIVTQHDQPELRQAASEIGCVGFLSKEKLSSVKTIIGSVLRSEIRNPA